MGCGGSRDVVVEMPRKAPRRASLPSAAEERKGSATELFSRPGSGPVVLSPECRGRKNKIGIENNTNGSSTSPTTVGSFGDTIRSPLADKNSSKETRLVNTGSTKTVLPKIESSSPPKAYLNEDYRKGSAQSKASQDSGIGEDQLKPAVLPPVTSSSPVTLPAIESKNGGSGQSGGLVPRLASEEILSQLNEIGIVPLKTNRCGSSLAFNIELDNGSKHPHSSNSEDEVRGGGVGAGAGGEGRMLPPLPPSRLHRLNSLPPIQPPSIEVLDAKQKKAEQRRKILQNRDEKIRQKSEKLRQRRLSETELSERDDDMKEKVSQDIQQKQQLIEQNKQKLKEAQEERKRRNEERLQRVRMNKEKLMMNGGGGYGDKLDDSYSDPIESGAIDTGDQSDLDGSGDVGKLNDATGGNGLPGAGGDIRGTQRNIVEGTNAAGEPNEDDIF